MNSEKDLISVVVPAYNEEKLITECIVSLAQQNTKRKYEVIVVDNNSTDQTPKILKSFLNKLNLKIINEKIKGRGAARYAGFKIAKGNIVLSTDADTVVPNDWVEQMAKEFEANPDIVAITGMCELRNTKKSIQKKFKAILPISMKLYRYIFGLYWVNGFNFGVRRDAYEATGGFSRALNVQEDTDLSFKLNKIGDIKFIPSIKVFVSGRRFKDGLIKGLLPYIKSFSLFYLFKRNDVILDDPR